MKQLALPIRLNEAATLENYIAGPNVQLHHYLRRFLDTDGELQAYLWAASARGKSHLLQAMCHRAAASGVRASYLPLASMTQRRPEMFDGMERLGLIAIDDLDLISADEQWAEALFHLINRCRQSGCRLLFAAKASPHRIEVALPDLKSRLSWGPVFHLDPLGDAELLTFIRNRARQRGLTIPAEAAHYIVKHLPRDIRYLETLIAALDDEALASRRRVTLPLVKRVVEASC